MSLSAGIVGLPNVGKSTIFNALTSGKAQSANYPFCTIDPNVGVVPVPDPRLKQIQKFITTEKVIPAALEIVDIAGLVRGASKGEGLGNQFLANIRQVDAILHVVRCFEGDVIHVDGSVDAMRDVETIETELMLADMDSLEKRLKRIAKMPDKESKTQAAAIRAALDKLNDGQWLAHADFSELEREALKPMFLLSMKEVLYIANVHEDELGEENAQVAALREHAAKAQAGVVLISGKIESELSDMEAEEAAEFLSELGLEEPGLHALTRETYRLLGLQSYFTAGKKEIRAWTVRVGAKAPEAAGVIHTDFERGFIRAEVFTIADLEKHQSEAEIRNNGVMRQEGKEYVVADGDIMHFKFNV
ncbi:redox-regulated ATPase YchF [Acanthopleuribacter pedis]|uniref:Ribosome-binding ATPase YchF n=1 Tax=Acanthopleuribacter pedis TaxID=442870 RepID=A0A8J7QL78_9BACT|nr:redox-regulated ATPase YchF [Acanthopleuribacter pedis]MBO1320020.1 redox-regulated ATPase YchF [Acanthopleuribacter pedis]